MVGALTRAVENGVSAIAFSGAHGDPVSWLSNERTDISAYSSLALHVTNMFLRNPKNPRPYLRDNIWLNVNFPRIDDLTCNQAPRDFKYVLSRILDPADSEVDVLPDVEHCGSRRLPLEKKVIETEGCYVSITVAWADSKSDASADEQRDFRDMLGGALACLPEDD